MRNYIFPSFNLRYIKNIMFYLELNTVNSIFLLLGIIFRILIYNIDESIILF